jgi:hypothetical protein
MNRLESTAMKTLTCLLLASIPALASMAAIAGEGVYRSVDAAGNVTYSDSPPVNAVEVEGVPVQEGPSPEVTREALERSERMTQEADARYEAIKERRRQEAEAREQARQEAQAARQRELQQAPDDTGDDDADVIYVVPRWHRHHRPPPPAPPLPAPYPQLRANPPQEADAREAAGQRPRDDADIIDTVPQWHRQHGPRPPPPSRPPPPPTPPPSPYPYPQLRSTP